MTQLGEPAWISSLIKSLNPGAATHHVILLSWGAVDEMFTDECSTVRGRQERMMAADYFHGPIGNVDTDESKSCWSFWRNAIEAQDKLCYTEPELEKTVKKRLQNLIAGADESLPSLRHERDPTADVRLIMPGTFCFTEDSQLGYAAASHRFLAEESAWQQNSGLGKFPLIARVLEFQLPYSIKPAAGIQICFQFVPAFPTPDEHKKLLVDRLAATTEWPHGSPSNPRDYVRSRLSASSPFGFNAPTASGGKTPADVLGSLIADKPPPRFQHTAGTTGRPNNHSVVVTTNAEGVAGIAFTPSRIAGDCYKIKVFSLSKPESAVETGRMQVWRHLRIAKIIEKPPVTGYVGSPAAPSTLMGSLGTISRNSIRDEFKRMFFAVTFDAKAGTPQKMTASDYKAAITDAKTAAKANASLPAFDFDALVNDDINSPFTIWIRDDADYNTRRSPTSRALDLTKSSHWDDISQVVDFMLPEFLNSVNRDSRSGITACRGEIGDSYSYWGHQAAPAGWTATTSGVAQPRRGFFLWYPESAYSGNFPYPLHVNFMHEMGHVIFLRHHYTKIDPSTGRPAGQAPDNHDDKDYCLMGYLSLTTHDHCGRCNLKLKGYDETKI